MESRTKLAKNKENGRCPITGRGCRLCTLYRARHYYALNACKEYRLRLHRLATRPLNTTEAEAERTSSKV